MVSIEVYENHAITHLKSRLTINPLTLQESGEGTQGPRRPKARDLGLQDTAKDEHLELDPSRDDNTTTK